MRVQKTSEADTKLWTKREVARVTNLSVRSVDNWIARKIIPYIKLKGSVRFIPSDVEAFIKSRRISG
jgi:excisionase family DNA binding protein